MKEVTLDREELFLCKQAFLTNNTKGRQFSIEDCPVRTDFQRDRDRITHSKSFRRLMHKMQVFLSPEGDHYRTRLTHTLEVTQIARTLARALCLNEDLTEAAALGHDLGHTPFGHSGERALDKLCPGGFRHYEQSLRVVDKLENNCKGLNLTFEVRDGILNHSGDNIACTLEGQIIKFADRIAYINHDIDDAVRAGILTNEDIPDDIMNVLGYTHSDRITSLISAVIEFGTDKGKIGMTEPHGSSMMKLREFMFKFVYSNPKAKSEDDKVMNMIAFLFDYYYSNIDALPKEYLTYIETDGKERIICDHIASMTDRFALSTFEDLFVPKVWQYK
ncbi:MAG: deoxyguanosinetriphosphate triphosphohydrolase [Clostridiales bacterium GWF2_36_10]|nr:MAG: deoxyguanosinetriphosphate triphosphohydrolase [Clostridiales bacterium GWF2_36_10]HAN20821.1 deoxyguanosinetriphosphate triphosphohydrolase [Clostridiales bacterium]